ncbi:MAG: response regulator [Treponema sp.]|nr:response regulator [Treponema sp.]
MYKVLIVEDDPMVAMINEQYVCKNKEFSVVKSCRNGQEALDYLTEKESDSPKIDLIIMDVFMPYMNGIETLKKIRELKIDSEVIMVTAANDTATLEETMHLGVIDFLIKPFAYERFQVALEKFAAKTEALRKKDGDVIDQSYIDNLISGSSASVSLNTAGQTSTYELPKGIQKKTLDLIIGYFKEHSGWISGDKVAEDVGLSSVTIRHYMSYLVEKGQIRADINYETGGRPSMLYSVK